MMSQAAAKYQAHIQSEVWSETNAQLALALKTSLYFWKARIKIKD
jgi:hypothetical protein